MQIIDSIRRLPSALAMDSPFRELQKKAKVRNALFNKHVYGYTTLIRTSCITCPELYRAPMQVDTELAAAAAGESTSSLVSNLLIKRTYRYYAIYHTATM